MEQYFIQILHRMKFDLVWLENLCQKTPENSITLPMKLSHEQE